MPETVTEHRGVIKWQWYDIMHDLEAQAGLTGVIIDPLSVGDHFCGGEYQGNRFMLTWMKDRFLLVSMQKFSAALVQGFAKIVEYEPFCRYVNVDMVTVEWDAVSPLDRFGELKRDGTIRELAPMVSRVNWAPSLAEAIKIAPDGATIVVYTEAMKEMAERAAERTGRRSLKFVVEA